MLDWTFSTFVSIPIFFYWNADTEVKISAAPVDLNSNVLSQFESISIKWIEWSSFPLLTRIQFDSIPVSFNEASIDQWSKWFQIEDCPNSSRIPIQVESQFKSNPNSTKSFNLMVLRVVFRLLTRIQLDQISVNFNEASTDQWFEGFHIEEFEIWNVKINFL